MRERSFISGLLGGGLLAGLARLDAEKDVGVLDLDLSRDAAPDPVADSLRAASKLETEQLGDGCGSAKRFDEVSVVVHNR